jgi:hypothetical protein
VTLPKEILTKIDQHQPLNQEESRLFASHPEIAGRLLASIPRLEDVAAIVPAQCGTVNFAAQSSDVATWDLRSIGRLLLRAAIEFDGSISGGMTREAAVAALRTSKLGLPQTALDGLLLLNVASKQFTVRQLRLKDLHHGMVLDEDLVSMKGIRLVSAGHEVTRSLLIKLASFAEGIGVAEPFRVRVMG